MPRYEVKAVICIDARDEADLKIAIEQCMDVDGGADIPTPSGPNRFIRAYPDTWTVDGSEALVIEEVDQAISPAFEPDDEATTEA